MYVKYAILDMGYIMGTATSVPIQTVPSAMEI